MTTTLELTLAEARTEVLNRLGMGTQAGTTMGAHPLIDSFLNSSQRQLVFEADWVGLRRHTEIQLQDLQGTYDWPDEVEPGQIVHLVAIDTGGHEEPLQGGIRSVDRERRRNATEGTRPKLYDYHDGVIELLPLPNAVWTHLRVEYVATANRLVDHTDRLAFDSEAILQMAVILAKSHFGHSVTEIDRSERMFREYVKRIRAQQSNKGGFQFGGNQSRYQSRGGTRDRMATRSRSRRGVYFHGETPWS